MIERNIERNLNWIELKTFYMKKLKEFLNFFWKIKVNNWIFGMKCNVNIKEIWFVYVNVKENEKIDLIWI